MARAHLPTSIVCRECGADNLIGAVLCDGCGNLLSRAVADSPRVTSVPSHVSTGMDGENPRFIVTQLNGADVPVQAELSVPIPMDKLLSHDPIYIGRRVSRTPDYPPEMDFGFLFYYTDSADGYPISRKAAVLLGRDGTITLRRVGKSPISLKKAGKGLNCPAMQGVALEIENNDVLVFGRPDRHFRVLVVIPEDILKEI